MSQNVAEIYTEASVDGILDGIRSINNNIMMMKIESLNRLMTLSPKLYDSDSEYRESIDKLSNTIVKSGTIFRSHINDGLLKVEKWYQKTSNGKDFQEFYSKSDTIKKSVKDISIQCNVYYNNIVAVLRMYERELAIVNKCLKDDPNSKEYLAKAQIFKNLIANVKSAITEHISFSKKIAKKHTLLQDLVVLDF